MEHPKSKIKEYTNGEVTVVWQPGKCIHSEICFHGLPQVFDPKARPWIDVRGAGTEQLIAQVEKCPSGALSFYRNGETDGKEVPLETERIVQVVNNGPLLIMGDITVKRADGTAEKRNRSTAFCRCGGSANKPYCDGTHNKINFKG